MTGSKIFRMFHVIVITLCSRHHREGGSGGRSTFPTSRFSLLTSTPAPIVVTRAQRKREGGRGPGLRAILVRAYLTPSYLFPLLCIRPLLPGHASRDHG